MLEASTLMVLCALLLLAAALYSSVGHAGASAYLAAMALLGVAPAVMKPTALSLNVLVASLVTWRYARAGLFEPRLFWPFALTAIPAAYLGGGWVLPDVVYRQLVGGLLWLAALRLIATGTPTAAPGGAPRLWLALPAGALIGGLSGLTGTGGGIFLSPLLILSGWALPRQTLGAVGAFVLCNSLAGLAGNARSLGQLPSELPWLVASVLAGALLGTRLGVSARLPAQRLQQALALVLLIAGAKLLFS
ncbi:MAG TPA: sulfite exporter TauE/SafE family protein [Nevskiaceae bacterium]|nr:sulfite exporter TauE/SafE family protein [Nevskiaceae bacterium]